MQGNMYKEAVGNRLEYVHEIRAFAVSKEPGRKTGVVEINETSSHVFGRVYCNNSYSRGYVNRNVRFNKLTLVVEVSDDSAQRSLY